jgi:hypothetical protein
MRTVSSRSVDWYLVGVICTRYTARLVLNINIACLRQHVDRRATDATFLTETLLAGTAAILQLGRFWNTIGKCALFQVCVTVR